MSQAYSDDIFALTNDEPLPGHEPLGADRERMCEQICDQLVKWSKDPLSTDREIRVASGQIITLNGRWGSGKTSMVNRIEYLLRNKVEKTDKGEKRVYGDPLIVRFNPWIASSPENLISLFFSRLIHEVRNYDSGEWRRSCKRAGKLYRMEQLRSLLSDYSGLISVFGKKLDTILGSGGILSAFLGFGVGSASKNLEKSARINGDIHKLKEEIDYLCEDLDFPLIVIIDEVDRLERDELIAVLKLLRAIADFRKISYLVAIDIHHAAALVGRDLGYSYIQKFFPLRFDLEHSAFDAFIDKYREEALNSGFFDSNSAQHFNYAFERVVKIIFRPEEFPGPVLISNFRELKKAMNGIAIERKRVFIEIDPIDFLIVCILKYIHPEAWDIIQKNIGNLVDDSTTKRHISLVSRP